MTTEQPTPPPVDLSTAMLVRFEEAVSNYWECAYQEGRSNRSRGDEANAILHEIRCAVKAFVSAEHARMLDTLTRHDWHANNIWRHYYPSATGDYVDLRELRKVLAPNP